MSAFRSPLPRPERRQEGGLGGRHIQACFTSYISTHICKHLLLANYDIQTIQKLLGHGDVRTTMIYLQTVPV